MGLYNRLPPGSPDQEPHVDADLFDIGIRVRVKDVALLWRMAAAHALSMPGLEPEDVEEIIGPMEDPSLADCLGLLLTPKAIAGCSFAEFSVNGAAKPPRSPRRRKSRIKTLRVVSEPSGPSPTFPGLVRPVLR